jgi:23S rRNA pseudouridine955/2504/2580 synthase
MIKFPIVLDDEYGNRKFNQKFRHKFHLGRHFLHAWKIAFMHPISNKYIQLAAPLPPDLDLTLKRLNIPLPNA